VAQSYGVPRTVARVLKALLNLALQYVECALLSSGSRAWLRLQADRGQLPQAPVALGRWPSGRTAMEGRPYL
jgi:hypothetical protein